MVLVCGDTHGTHDIHKLRNLKNDCIANRINLTKKDYVIICGDFGLIWNSPYTKEYYGEETWSIESNPQDNLWDAEELTLLKWYESCPWTTLFVDGNHENFDRLDNYPITEWHGGRVQKISKSIIHLMRGEIYTIDGYTFFCMGGAMSTDRGSFVGDEKQSKGRWWWPQELPSADEWNRSFENLNKIDWKVDFIITHDAPAGINIHKDYRISEVSNRLEQIRTMTDFTHWFCGHMHEDQRYGKVSILYRQKPVNIEDYFNEYTKE